MARETSSAQPPADRPPTVDTLALRAMDGDEAAFEELHRRLGGGLRGFFHRRIGGDNDLIEELSQNTWVEVWRTLRGRRYDPDRARITTFIYAIGYKMVLRHARAARRKRATGPLDDCDALVETWLRELPEDLLHCTELIDAVRDCLHRTGTPFSLTEEERAAVVGAAGDETERTLARRLGVAASTVNARKKTAYTKLRLCLARKGFTGDIAERGRRKSEQ